MFDPEWDRSDVKLDCFRLLIGLIAIAGLAGAAVIFVILVVTL